MIVFHWLILPQLVQHILERVDTSCINYLLREVVPYCWDSVVERVCLHSPDPVFWCWFVYLEIAFPTRTEPMLEGCCDSVGVVGINMFEHFNEIPPKSTVNKRRQVELPQSLTV